MKPEITLLDEKTLAEQAAAGEISATRQLLHRAIPRIKRTAKYLCSVEAEREEIVQNTLIELVYAVGTFRGESSFNYWVDRVTVNTATKLIDKSARRRRIQDRTWFPPVELRSVEEEIDLEKMRARLCEHLNFLKPPERIPLVLHYLHGYKVDEISTIMKLKPNTVRGRLRCGLKKIRKRVLNDSLLSSWIQGGRI